MSLAHAAIVLHGAACVLFLVYAYALRRSKERQAAYVIALVWLAWFGLDRVHAALVEAIPPPDVEPIASFKARTLLDLERAVYLAWPALFLGWIRWTFSNARPWPVVLAWVAVSALPSAIYPALRGESWFRYAGAIHGAALIGEVAAIVSWARLREPPRPWHSIAIVAAGMCAFPAIPFFASAEARAGYLIWVLRALVALHLSVLAVVGGELWNQRSRGSSS